jgi:hypothetical protein
MPNSSVKHHSKQLLMLLQNLLSCIHPTKKTGQKDPQLMLIKEFFSRTCLAYVSLRSKEFFLKKSWRVPLLLLNICAMILRPLNIPLIAIAIGEAFGFPSEKCRQ